MAIDQKAPRDGAIVGARATRRAPSDNSAWFAGFAFGVAGVVAFVMFLVIGRDVWFSWDEWDFLAARSITIHDVFAMHAGHLVALPVVAYRALFAVFGLRTYVPYQILSVSAHVVSAVLLRVVMRRAGVGPWIATAAASLFLFFGAGGEDIIWGFQITFVGALAFGLVQLLLVDHRGPVDRRDWYGLGAGALALLCSSVAITMVIVVGLATLARRGWRVATLQTAPLAAAYGLWAVLCQRQQYRAARRHGLLRWDQRGITATFDALGQVRYVGWILGAVLVTGLVLAWKQRRGSGMLHTSAVLPLALLAGAFFFLTTTGAARAGLGFAQAASSRYVYIVAALVLPAVALAADAVVRAFDRSRAVAAGVILLLLLGLPGNVRATGHTVPSSAFMRRAVVSVPRLELATHVPGSDHLAPNLIPYVTVGWLLQTMRSGRLPGPVALTARQRATYSLMLLLDETQGALRRPCAPAVDIGTVVLQKGETLGIMGVLFVRAEVDGQLSNWLPYGMSGAAGAGPHRLTVTAGPLALHFMPTARGAFVCGFPDRSR